MHRLIFKSRDCQKNGLRNLFWVPILKIILNVKLTFKVHHEAEKYKENAYPTFKKNEGQTISNLLKRFSFHSNYKEN